MPLQHSVATEELVGKAGVWAHAHTSGKHLREGMQPCIRLRQPCASTQASRLEGGQGSGVRADEPPQTCTAVAADVVPHRMAASARVRCADVNARGRCPTPLMDMVRPLAWALVALGSRFIFWSIFWLASLEHGGGCVSS